MEVESKDTGYKLKLCWLPIIQFSKLIDNLSKETEIDIDRDADLSSNKNQIRSIKLTYKNLKIYIDSLGFLYLEPTKNETTEEEIREFIEIFAKSLSIKNRQFLNDTFLNKDIINNRNNNNDNLNITDFIENISININKIDSLDIKHIEYSLNSTYRYNFFKKNRKSKVKLTIKDNATKEDLNNIINRNLVKILEKSIFYTHSLEFEENEIYNLSIFKNNSDTIEQLTNNLEFILKENGQEKDSNKKILTNAIKKAIQDTFEENVLLNFLDITKKSYLSKVYDKIADINRSLEELNSKILAVDNITGSYNTEEEIEIFIQKLLYSIPKFKAIDSKIKAAYYLRIGNLTTSTNVDDSETIEHTFYYQKWRSSIEYFENMAQEIKNIITIYHQNKNIKSLEDVVYYENYQSDIEDIRNIQGRVYTISDDAKSYLKNIGFFVAIASLSGEAPIFKISKEDKFELIKKIYDIVDTESATINRLIEVTINFIFYLIVFIIIYKLTKQIYRLIKWCIDSFRTKYYIFDSSDYDKHEHRSTKALYNVNEKQENTICEITYNEVDSAYELIKELKKYKLKKYIKREYEYNIFPEILKEPYKYGIQENYRISRIDKVITKILFRYKIINFELNKFIKIIKESCKFTEYYEAISENEKILDQIIRDLENLQNVNLTIYIVYSFTLKMNKKNGLDYTYNIIKDQYRVHYHIDKLPKNKLNKYQESIAKLVYIYFLARFKKFRN